MADWKEKLGATGKAPDPKVHIPCLQHLVEEAWLMNTITKTHSAGEITFAITIRQDALPVEKKGIYALALACEA
jgi:hypothetical protein